MVADIKDIMKVLPHRPPFLLIDRIEEVVPGQKVVATKNVTMNEPHFVGHFPQEPVMPGVLVIEAMAQAGAYAVLSMEEYKGKIAFLGGVDKAKFRQKIVPGDTLKIEVEIIKLKSIAGIGKGTAYVNGKKAVEAEITFIIG